MEKTQVVLETSMGEIHLELYPEKAPVTVKNFISYVQDGSYAGTIFHRVINGFMIQGGGMDKDLNPKKNRSPIKNEATNGLKNENGTIAMARTNEVDSATAQFFINVNDNNFLDHRSTNPSEYGYAVFGRVIKGMDIVNQIKTVKTVNKGAYSDVPESSIVINAAKIL